LAILGETSELIEETSTLPIHTNPQFLIEHPEESTFAGFVRRLLRDVEWRIHSARALGRPSASADFEVFRRTWTAAITDQIERLPPQDTRRLGHQWLRHIRDQLYDLQQQGILSRTHIEPLVPQGLIHDAHRFIYDLISTPHRLDVLIDSLQRTSLIGEAAERSLRRIGITEKEKFKIIQLALEADMERSLACSERDHPDLHLTARVVQRAMEARAFLETSQGAQDLLRRTRLEVSDPVSIERQRQLSCSNFVYKVRTQGNRSLFLRYHDPLGSQFFQRHSPRKNTFIYVLAHAIFEAVLGPEGVIPILYPPLEVARSHYYGPAEENDLERIAQSVIIQPDMHAEDYVELEQMQDSSSQKEVVRIFGDKLGEVHGKTLGIARHYRERSSRDPELMSLLQIAEDDIRFPDAETYSEWLLGPNWVTRLFHALEDAGEKAPEPYRRVAEKIRSRTGRSLRNHFQELALRSAERFAHIGCLGHLDFKPNNIFFRSEDERVKIYDFDYITFIDPVYEAGQSIYSVAVRAIRQGRGDQTMVERLIEDFERAYFDRLLGLAASGNRIEERFEIDRKVWTRDSRLFAGITLLSVFAASANRQSSGSAEADMKMACDIADTLLS